MKKKKTSNLDTSLSSGSSGENEFDFTLFKKQVISGLMQGKPLTGEDGLLKPLIANFVEAALDAEMGNHIAEEKSLGITNRRNGKKSKSIRTSLGTVEINYDRDRNGSFEPITVRKRQHELGVGFDNQILELYAMGTSVSNIESHLLNMYGAQMSQSRISDVINSTWEVVKAWQNRPLPSLYVVLFVDAIQFKIRRDGAVQPTALYVMYGITVEGQREIVALYAGQSVESATEWARCLADLKRRGLEDVLILCSDGLTGLKSVLEETFPLAKIQRCVVHKIRNCFKFLDNKDSKLVLQQLKGIYMAVNEVAAKQALEDFGNYWNGKYEVIVQLWLKDWDELMACMQFGPTLRKITYTTNAVENLNREIRRITKSKGAWVSDKALMIQLFLALERSKKSWHKKVHNWASVQRELSEIFGTRFTKYLIK